MQLGSEPWIPDKQILEICHCRSETILLTPNSSCEACSGTHVTARWIARPPNAAFVTRLRSVRLLVQTARQLPDQSTTLWVMSISMGLGRVGRVVEAAFRAEPDNA